MCHARIASVSFAENAAKKEAPEPRSEAFEFVLMIESAQNAACPVP
jgi:hypothetical protein